MKKEFLEDYASKEREEYEKYVKQVLEDGIEKAGIYPRESRFSKLNKHLVRAESSSYYTDNEKVWSQIPFAGTLLISLHNAKENNLLRLQGFEKNDISKLIDLAKETGKVQFGLRSEPENYEGLDYLDPIFTELQPPVFTFTPLEYLTELKTWKKWREEYFTLASIKFDSGLATQVLNMDESKEFYFRSRDSCANAYAQMKFLKMDEVVEMISNLMIDEPAKAYSMFEKYFVLLTPQFDSIKASCNVSLSHMKRSGINVKNKQYDDIIFPVDIGKHIMKKIVQNPSSYYGCINVIENYNQNDLYNLLYSLDTAVKNNNKDLFEKNAGEINTILDNVWKDAKKIEGQKENIRSGISLTLGLIGGLATSMIGGYPGILAGLGFNIADRKLETSNLSLSEKIVKTVNSDFLVNVYDFTKKYPLKT